MISKYTHTSDNRNKMIIGRPEAFNGFKNKVSSKRRKFGIEVLKATHLVRI